MGRKLDKFLLLMWKNWMLQYRKPLQTAVEILAPVLFSTLLVIIRSLVDPIDQPTHIYIPFNPLPLPKKIPKTIGVKPYAFLQNLSLVYSPTGNKVLDDSMKLLNLVFREVKGYNSSEELEAHFFSGDNNDTIAGIQFSDKLCNRSDLPFDLEVSLRFPAELRGTSALGVHKYNNFSQTPQGTAIDKFTQLFLIRDWRTNQIYPIFESPGPRNPAMNNGAIPGYYTEGFLTLQAIVTFVLVIGHKGYTWISKIRYLQPVIRMQRFPYSRWRSDPLLPALIGFIGMLTMLSLVYTCINMVKVITTEKEKQLKEVMKIMGLPNWLHWAAWFIKYFIFLLISMTFVVILLKIPWYSHSGNSIFTYANPLVILLFLLFYICTTITFSFAVSVFFSKANTAAGVAALLWFLSYSPYMFLQRQYEQVDMWTKLVASLGSNTAMAYGFQLILMFEATGEGIQWNNVWKPTSPDDNLTLGILMVMLVIDCFVYLIVALYVEAVLPGEYGTPQPWFFLFTSNFWCRNPNSHGKIVDSVGVNDFTYTATHESEFFEEDPHLVPGIQILKLRKEFGKKIAVKNLSFKIYQDQITVLLGHNGAGKTTTMSMLCGILPSTDGTAIILGYDIRTHMKNVRTNLGLCPQHNILFDDLTVKEHLYFFGSLKELRKEEVGKEIDKYVKLLSLESKMNQKAKTLSGGMKRKLCVGIALCGDSKIVLLDEPTAGMDPVSRRALWNLLQDQKKDRCILLTTHHMDEADLLGDRIAIMSGGELKCYGSSFFLKKKFGTGYYLIIDKDSGCNSAKITEFLRNYVPKINIRRDAGSELLYLLNEANVSIFKEMFADLEQNIETLKIRSYGVTLATLEEVFMKVGTDSTDDTSLEKSYRTKSMGSISTSKQSSKKLLLLTKSNLLINQIIAMFMKRILSITRTWVLFFIQVLTPIVFLIIAVTVTRSIPRFRLKELPKLEMTLDSYKDPIILVEDDGTVPFSKHYYKMIEPYKVANVSSITATMLNLSKTSSVNVRKYYLLGASFTSEENIPIITAWFNNNPFHTPPLALGLVLNIIYKEMLGNNFSVRFANYPLPFRTDTKIQKLVEGDGMGFQLAFNIGFSMAFVSSFYVLFYVKERVCKSKHLQFVSGVRGYIFWITSYICDQVTFVVTVLILLTTLLCFQEEGYTSVGELGRMFLILFAFSFSMLPMMYLASYFFDIPSTGYTRMALFSIFTGVTTFLVVRILSIPELLLENVATALHWGFLLIPHYSLATAIRDSYVTFAVKKICNLFINKCLIHNRNMTTDKCLDLACNNNFSKVLLEYCCDEQEEYYKWESPGIGRNLLYSLVVGLVLFITVLLREYEIVPYIIHQCCRRKVAAKPQRMLEQDDDVFSERQKIHNVPEVQLRQDFMILIKDLTKYYKKFLAVNALCVGVKQFECFGLLGINGAGKTTTFKMLTGDLKPSYGDAWMSSFSIATQIKDVQKVIGYCPQFDALLPDLTAKETLTIFALLRGVPMKECKQLSEKLALDFDFYKHLNKRVKQLSGGNRRKLSTAVSLIGDPPVICLDEPTAGMDPATKRHLWNALSAIRDGGKCILFTSHSMEECEALCTRLAIMVNGNFECLGSIQHLKNKFFAGYTLKIKVKRMTETTKTEEELNKIDLFIRENFPTATQQEKHHELLSYHIVDRVTWSQMFEILEEAKNELNIEDYSLGQSTLEQIFLKLTRHQR